MLAIFHYYNYPNIPYTLISLYKRQSCPEHCKISTQYLDKINESLNGLHKSTRPYSKEEKLLENRSILR